MVEVAVGTVRFRSPTHPRLRSKPPGCCTNHNIQKTALGRHQKDSKKESRFHKDSRYVSTVKMPSKRAPTLDGTSLMSVLHINTCTTHTHTHRDTTIQRTDEKEVYRWCVELRAKAGSSSNTADEKERVMMWLTDLFQHGGGHIVGKLPPKLRPVKTFAC